MKIRTDYVTNSSSSSFIIAQNDKCTEEEIKNALVSMKKEIKDVLENYSWDYVRNDYKNISEENINEFIENMTDNLFGTYHDLQLGEWGVSAATYSNESDEYEGFMYEYGHKLSTENFKVQPSDW